MSARPAAARSRGAFSALARRSTGARVASAWPSATAASPNVAMKLGQSQAGTSAAALSALSGGPARKPASSRSVKTAGACVSPVQRAITSSTAIVNASAAAPSASARPVSSPIRSASERRRRSASYTNVPIAERSPEPAKRCAFAHSLKANGAVRWRSKTSSSTSIAPARRPAARITKFLRLAVRDSRLPAHRVRMSPCGSRRV